MPGADHQTITFEDFIDRANTAQSVDELVRIFQHALHQHGLDRMHFCLLSDHDNIGLKAGVGFIENYPRDWMRYYFEQGFDKIDPVICYAYQKAGSFQWSEIERNITLTAPQRQCLHMGIEAGLYHGMCTPLFGPNRFAGVGLASSEKRDSFDGRIDMISAYCMHFFTAFQRLHYTREQVEEHRNIYLTPREREVLTWVARGKSSTDIADIIMISTDGVNHHLRNIYHKLGTNNRTVAACKAITYGLITQ